MDLGQPFYRKMALIGIPLYTLHTRCHDPGYKLLTDEEIIQQVVNPSAEEDADLEDEEDQDEPTTTFDW